jgi:hypothetical protein
MGSISTVFARSKVITTSDVMDGARAQRIAQTFNYHRAKREWRREVNHRILAWRAELRAAALAAKAQEQQAQQAARASEAGHHAAAHQHAAQMEEELRKAQMEHDVVRSAWACAWACMWVHGPAPDNGHCRQGRGEECSHQV